MSYGVDGERNCEFESTLKPCCDCGELLSGKAIEHGLYGFGHDGRCCGCYEVRQRGERCDRVDDPEVGDPLWREPDGGGPS